LETEDRFNLGIKRNMFFGLTGFRSWFLLDLVKNEENEKINGKF